MSYQVLARRWRPQTFDEVVGQEPVTRTLKNALRQGRVAHAFLFAGPRGVGKTTTARILAKALNCDEGPTPEPCNRCLNCREITAGAAVDCVEIDGASHTGVEHVRDLQEQLIYQPVRGRSKVYIIDEVHMLSLSAFNALLKTLEAPPPKVVFILATTEPHKVPPTIHSRCQRYDFRRIGQGLLVERLRAIAQAEGVEVTPEALAALARAADGSLRDAQSILDQVIAYAEERVTAEEVAAVLGWTPAEVVRAVVEACLAGEAGRALELLEELLAKGGDLRALVFNMLESIRSLLLVKLTPRAGEILGLAPEAMRELERWGTPLEISQLELALRFLLEAEGEMRRSAQPRSVLEMALVRMAEARGLQSLGSLIKRLESLEARLGAPAAAPGLQPGLFAAEDPSTPPGSATGEETGLEGGWQEVRRRIGVERRALAVLLAEAEVSLEGETLTLTFANGNHFSRSTLEDPDVRNLLTSVVSEVFGRRLRVSYRFAPSGVGGPEQGPVRIPARNHPLVLEALEVFGGRIVEVVEGGDTVSHRGEA
ncbi:MAG: DNA polymerase III subunit gamma/tau [Candidatus Methylomirabilales bacterium]